MVRVAKEYPIAYRLVTVINREGTLMWLVLPGLCTSHKTMELKTRLNTSFHLIFSIVRLSTFCFPVLNSLDMPSISLQRPSLLFGFSPLFCIFVHSNFTSPLCTCTDNK